MKIPPPLSRARTLYTRMPGITRVGADSAGGRVLPGSNSTVLVNGLPAAVLGNPVQGHGDGSHSGPRMASASGTVYVSGIPVCRMGDTASCGHKATGSGDVLAG